MAFQFLSEVLSIHHQGWYPNEELIPSIGHVLIATAVLAIITWLADQLFDLRAVLQQFLRQKDAAKVGINQTATIIRRYHLFGTNGPPCVPYEVPYFGSALAFRKDAFSFVQKYGNVFSKEGMFAFRIRSTRVVMVTDPDAAAFVTSGRIPQLTFQQSKYMMMRNSMGMSGEAAKFISHQTKAHVLIHRHLLEKRDLSHMVHDWQRYFNDVYVPAALSRCQKEKKRISIYHFFGECVYCATARLFFGNSQIATSEQFENALVFDNKFTVLSRHFSRLYQRLCYPKELKAREDFVDAIRAALSDNNVNGDSKNNVCQLVGELEDLLSDIDADDRIRYFGLLFFASILNTVPTLFWVVYYLLASDGALEAVRKEVNDILEKRLQNDKGNGNSKVKGASPIFSLAEMEEMKCIDSIITETLRMKSTAVAFRFRRAVKDVNVSLTVQGTAKKFHVKKNDLFLTCPTLVHFDPNVYPNPTEFKWDRFLNNPEGTFPVYRKDDPNIKVKSPLDAFGGGPSICPGRKFARCEMKAAVASMVSRYDIRFSPDNNGLSVVPPPPTMNTKKSIMVNGSPTTDVFIEILRKKESL